MPAFRSNSSAATTMTVTLTQVGRGNGYVRYRCNWAVETGSATSLGNNTGNWRNLRIHRASDGAQLCDVQIKAQSAFWNPSSTYSGSFEFNVSVGHAAGSMSVYIQTNSTGTQSCIWTDRDYCTNFGVSWTKYWTNCGAATGLKFSANPFENSVTLSWTKGADGVNNPITGYELYYRLNSGADTKVVLGDVASYTLNTSGFARGALLDYYLKSISEENTANSARSSQARKNRAPNQPTSPAVPKTSYVPGETIKVSFANIGDPDSNLSGFEVATDVNETIVGSRAGTSIDYVDVDTDGWTHGIKRKFRVRGYDTFGVRGPWSTYTAEVTMNTAPNAPEINYPAAGSTVYNQRPRVLLTAGASNDGPKHILCVDDGSEKTTAANGYAFSTGTSDSLASGREVVYRPSADLGTGNKSVSSRMYDSFLYSSQVSRSFTIGTFAPTDPDISIPGMPVKAVHVAQLQTTINNLRAAYGLGSYSFTAVVAGTTPIGDVSIITQLQAALQGVIDRINGWDSGNATFDISVTWIDPAAAGGGVDRVKFRQAIEQLRSMITAV